VPFGPYVTHIHMRTMSARKSQGCLPPVVLEREGEGSISGILRRRCGESLISQSVTDLRSRVVLGG
jgi:hypothetical protein